MFRTFTIICVFLVQALGLEAQDIQFNQGNWTSTDIAMQRILVTVLANEERVDSVFTEDLETGDFILNIQKYPLARYEYHPSTDQFPSLWRRIDIRQLEIADTMYVENLSTGYLEMTVQRFIKDIPNGAYHEFFPNGNIRIMGTLDGYNPDGTLKKTGVWKEWNAEGKVIREETYP